MSDLPEVNTRAGFLAPGWRVWRFGRWHTITAVQASPPRNMYIVTDEQTGTNRFGPVYRSFHVHAEVLVAAEPPEEQQGWLNVADQEEAA